MPIDHSKLVLGQQVSAQTLTLDEATVSRYVDAVDDRSSLSSLEGKPALVPPMAVAALSMGGVVSDLEISAETVHAGQQLSFNRPVRVGGSVSYEATLVQNAVRRGFRLIVVDMVVHDEAGRNVMSGKSTIVIPA